SYMVPSRFATATRGKYRGARIYTACLWCALCAHLAWMNSARQLAYQANVLDVRTFTSLSCRRFTLLYHPVDVCNSRKA
ncbi:hypothetical protein, partial [Idiomarina abyssalis]|uniref:hypothetical protein n=1 Tax=Idiomarina abyssalis TaxID=86102 RepID=UPI001F35D476